MPDFRIPGLPAKPAGVAVGPGWLLPAWCPDDDITYRVDYADFNFGALASQYFPSKANDFANGQPPYANMEAAVVWMLQNWLVSTGQTSVGSAPSVALSANPQTLQAGQDVEFTVLAIPSSGVNISKVQIKNGNQLLFEFPANATSFKWVWKSVALGNYAIQATATDSDGKAGKSNVIALPVTSATGTTPVVTQPVAPTFSGFDDVANTVSVSHATLPASELVYDFNGATGIAVPLNNVVSVGNLAGQVVAYARANGSRPEGLRANSQPFTVAATQPNAPTVALTSPQAGQTVNIGQPISLNAAPQPGTNAVAKVEFLEDGIKFSETTAAPHTVQRNISSGAHNYTARVVDTAGLSALSNAIAITGYTVVYDNIINGGDSYDEVAFGAIANDTLEFNNVADKTDKTPVTMDLYVAGDYVASIPYVAYRTGKAFRYTHNGIKYTNNFTATRIDL